MTRLGFKHFSNTEASNKRLDDERVIIMNDQQKSLEEKNNHLDRLDKVEQNRYKNGRMDFVVCGVVLAATQIVVIWGKEKIKQFISERKKKAEPITVAC